MLKLRARSYENGEPVQVTIVGDRIRSVEPAWPDGTVGDWPYVAPALFDLQINGHGGIWFSNDALTSDDVVAALRPHYRYGVTRLCPTLITNSYEGLAAGFAAIRAACETHPFADKMVCGCHLEGPYISSEDGPRGAHPREHVRAADWSEFQKLQQISGNRIKLVTIGPEVDGALEFIRRAVDSGVVIAIGHTAATPEQVRAAVDAGARLSTHLGNGAHAMIHRHRNYIFEQLADNRLTASLIVDGHHLPASLVQTFLKVKSPKRTILTCDAAGWAGCPPGVYESKLGRSEILENGKLVVAGQRELLAGSAQETDTCVANVIEFAGVSLKDAVDMASKNPARMLGYEVVRLRRGSLADLMVFRIPPEGKRLEIEATIAGGELAYGKIVSR
ncbi:MAG: amidohydrolase family protein [Planctomycetes bacterium]|nr:amidohydrolase family protein [Planctomycetota bacterium]